MTRRDKRRRLLGWLAELFRGKDAAASKRPVLLEPLEGRQLLAVDGLSMLLGSNRVGADSAGIEASGVGIQTPTVQGQGSFQMLLGEGELSGEGEPGNDLVAFAKALADSGTRFFGAAWCPFCTDQKELFEDGYKYLPYIEVTNPDRTPNEIATQEGITVYPTWEFPDGSRLTGAQSLETLSQRSGVAIPQSSTPYLSVLPNVTVGDDSPLHVPIDAYDPNGNPLTITVTSSNPNLLEARVLSGNRSLRLSTENFGDMVFELFEDRAPRPTGRVIELAEDGFYDGLNFHRVVNNFVIQGGDPLGNGTGGSTLGDFDDQFHLELQHNRTGVLSYAKSSDDTNDSQFFITEGPQRFLDFNHSVFGQLVEGEAVREAISNTAVNGSTPINPVVIETATIFNDTENGVVMLKPTGNGFGTSTITVTVSDTEGNSTQRSFTATVAQDTANGAPFLNDIPTIETTRNTPTTFTLTSQDAEGDPVVYSVTPLGNPQPDVSVNSSTGVVTINPPQGFVGELQFRATVQQTTTPTTTSATDTQTVTVLVRAENLTAPTAIDLLATSDLGISNSDNITSAASLVFSVSGTQAGAFVEVLAAGNVVGSATASGTTTQVTVSNAAALVEGATNFSARQSLDGETSGASPSLTVTLDRTPPVEVVSGIIPQSVIAGQVMNVDLAHPEEGQGLVYSISTGPAGLTVDPQTGVLSWTPTVSQLGPQTATLVLTDVAGNATNQTVSISVVDSPLVQVSINVVDLQGNPITTIGTGQTFKVQLITEDLRAGTARTGVFAAYVDLLFDPNVIEPVADSPITHVPPYNGTPVSGTVANGLIDELGSYSSSTPRLGPDPRVFAEVTFIARATGDAQLRTEPADNIGNDVLLYDAITPVSIDRMLYGSSQFAVGANFELVDDVFSFDEDSGVQSLDVLANDEVIGGAVLTIISVGPTSGGGTVTIAGNGTLLNYTSASNFTGSETFTYTARNQDNISRTATVTVQVTDVNDPPVALNDTFTVFINSTQNVLDVLLNDTTGPDDPSLESLQVTAVSAGSQGGSIAVGPSGLTVRYTPRADFQGTETFTYTLSDGRGGTATGNVSVSVVSENPPPTAQNDTFTLLEDAAEASYDVLANDSADDPEDTLSISAVGTSPNGSILRIAPDGQSVLYRPALNFNGQELLTYTVRDSSGATAVATITFNVTPVNDPPTAVDDNVTALSGAPTTTFDVLANDTNVDEGEVLTISAVTQPPAGSGTMAIASDGKSLIYTPPSSTFEGTFSVVYTLSDGTDLTDTATVNVTVRDFIPRTIAGTIDVTPSFFALSRYDLVLSGSDVTGAAVQRTIEADNGSFAFADLPPGQFTLQRPALPFLNDAGETIEINSGIDDGDFTANLQISGSMLPQYFGIRDFLGSTRQNSLTVAVNAAGESEWIAHSGSWSTVSSLNVASNTAFDALTVTAVNGSAQNVSAAVPVNGGRAGVIGQQSSMRLVRIWGSTADVGLNPPATPPATASTTTPASSTTNNALEGEGEGPAGDTPLTTTDVGIHTVDVNDSVSHDQALVQLTPQTGLSYLLGSNSAARSLSRIAAPPMAAPAVDAAMNAIRPELELRLSDDLERILASDSTSE